MRGRTLPLCRVLVAGFAPSAKVDGGFDSRRAHYVSATARPAISPPANGVITMYIT